MYINIICVFVSLETMSHTRLPTTFLPPCTSPLISFYIYPKFLSSGNCPPRHSKVSVFRAFVRLIALMKFPKCQGNSSSRRRPRPTIWEAQVSPPIYQQHVRWRISCLVSPKLPTALPPKPHSGLFHCYCQHFVVSFRCTNLMKILLLCSHTCMYAIQSSSILGMFLLLQ